MPCIEFVELESIWSKRYDRANHAEASGIFAVSESSTSRALTLRQCRARQTQAAHAMILHQQQCPHCNGSAQPQTAMDTLAS